MLICVRSTWRFDRRVDPVVKTLFNFSARLAFASRAFLLRWTQRPPYSAAKGEAATVSDKFEKGMAVRRAVLGDAHVDRAEAAKTDLDIDFQTFITEGAWGSVWTGEHLTKRERSIVTLALLAALGHDEEVAMHVRATRNTGASLDDIREALMHVAVYAGVPAANRAFKIVKRVVAEWDQENKGPDHGGQ